MKKRKFFSYLFMGLLAVGATGTVTSCKDYDDDINENKASIQSLQTALQACQSDCQTNIASLKSQLETVQGNIATLQSQIGTKADQSALETEISRATAQEAALTAQINTLQSALNTINTTLAGKVDQTAYDTTVADIYAKLQAVNTDLGTQLASINSLSTQLTSLEGTVNSVKADLQQQVDALDAYKTLMETNLGNLSTEKTNEINAAKAALQEQIDKLATAQSVTDLKAIVDGNVAKIDALQTQLNVLNVLVDKLLRSLVFIPDAYYYGVEATKVQALDYWKFNNVPTAAWNKTETRGYTNHARYDSTKASRMLTFVANYHMNPSSADVTKFGNLSILTDDKEFIGRAAASAPFVVKDYKAAGGDLQVSIDVAKPENIKNIPDNQAITVFALQVNTNKSGLDTTVTSDYATIYKESIKDLKLFHTVGTGVPFTGVKNTHDPSPALTGADRNHQHGNVLMQTANEAANDYPQAQDTVNYNETLDLSKLVEVHYTTVDGENRVMTAQQLAANGLSYKFELTGLYYGQSKTSESAHAAINPEDGKTLRPQMPEYDDELVGKQQAYGATQDRQEIGRTPLVRVELVDEDDNVLDYGYIRIRISEKSKTTPTTPDDYITYTAPNEWKYADNGECTITPAAWSYKTQWIQTEYDLYNKLGLTREEFNQYFTAETTANGDLVQYVRNASTGKFTKASTNYGVVYEHPDLAGQTAAQTMVLEWSITGPQMKQYFVDQNRRTISVAIRFASNNENYKDQYVVITTTVPASAITKTTPSGVASITPNILTNYWYAANTANEGTDEIHTQTLTPEDNAGGTATDLDNLFSDVFTGNNISAQRFITNITDLTAGKEYGATKLTLDLVFDQSNNNKEFKGYYNNATTATTFVLHVENNGKTLTANIKGQSARQTIATIEGGTVNQQKVVYQHHSDNNGYAEAMLNYKAHNELANDVINVVIGLNAQNQCAKSLPLTNNTFNVRFLRPLNVFDSEKEIEDAANAPQTINVADLVNFTDWRDLWNGVAEAGNGGDYYTYYGIQSITIDGVANGGNLSSNAQVTTNLSQANGSFVPLRTKSNQVDFTYSNGVITYKNLSSAVRDFDVKVPVQVKYVWGTVYKQVTIHVKKTLNNAKKH